MEVLVFVTAVINFVIVAIELSIAICHSRNENETLAQASESLTNPTGKGEIPSHPYSTLIIAVLFEKNKI